MVLLPLVLIPSLLETENRFEANGSFDSCKRILICILVVPPALHAHTINLRCSKLIYHQRELRFAHISHMDNCLYFSGAPSTLRLIPSTLNIQNWHLSGESFDSTTLIEKKFKSTSLSCTYTEQRGAPIIDTRLWNPTLYQREKNSNCSLTLSMAWLHLEHIEFADTSTWSRSIIGDDNSR